MYSDSSIMCWSLIQQAVNILSCLFVIFHSKEHLTTRRFKREKKTKDLCLIGKMVIGTRIELQRVMICGLLNCLVNSSNKIILYVSRRRRATRKEGGVMQFTISRPNPGYKQNPLIIILILIEDYTPVSM